MKKQRYMQHILILTLSLTAAVVIFLPSMFIFFSFRVHFPEISSPSFQPVGLIQTPDEIPVSVYLTEEERVVTVPLETYVRGVVAAEMPHTFALEALKGQAIASRTYIVQRLILGDFSDVPKRAVVTDTTRHQVFLPEEALKERWGPAYEENVSRVNQAVNETIGQVITYEGKPIYATFFSTSNGYTENADEYWEGGHFPYLKSVPSPWDTASPKYQQTVSMPVNEFLNKMSIDLSVLASVQQGPPTWFEILSKTTGGRVKTVRIGGETFSGREVREALGLASADFTLTMNGDLLQIHTVGYGHGIGMSQYGANGMAQEGKTAEEIVQYYYPGTELADYRAWLN